MRIKEKRMFPIKISCLIVALLCSALPALGQDTLPTLQPGQLPSLSAQPMTVAPPSDKNYSVECYLGNPNQKDRLGSLIATSATDAGPACNSMFFACKGSCYGCFSDFDFPEEICVDNAGRKYLR
jgi:hypothetical protein